MYVSNDMLWLYDEGARLRAGDFMEGGLLDFGNYPPPTFSVKYVGGASFGDNVLTEMNNQSSCKLPPVAVQ